MRYSSSLQKSIRVLACCSATLLLALGCSSDVNDPGTNDGAPGGAGSDADNHLGGSSASAGSPSAGGQAAAGAAGISNIGGGSQSGASSAGGGGASSAGGGGSNAAGGSDGGSAGSNGGGNGASGSAGSNGASGAGGNAAGNGGVGGNGGWSGGGGSAGRAGGGGSAGRAGSGGSGGGASSGGSGGRAGSGGTSASGGTHSGGTSSGGSGTTAGAGGTTAGGSANSGYGGKPSSGGSGGSGGKNGSAGASSGGGGSTSDACSMTTPPTGGTTVQSSNRTGKAAGLDWSIWSNGSGGSITTYSVPAFSAAWNNSGDFLARLGLQWNASKTYDQYGTITAQFNYKKSGSAGGYSYIGMYGWAVSPCVEWYIVDDSYNGMPVNPGNTTNKGTATIDGGKYTFYTRQTNGTGGSKCPNTTSWIQFYSIRQTARQCGQISVTEHFNAWAAAGMTLGKMDQAQLLIEVGGGTGTIDFTVANVTTTM